jgi:hypothetical protein
MIEKIFDSILSLFLYSHSQKGKKDRVVFERLMEELPPNSPAVDLLENQDMGSPFPYDAVSPLHLVLDAWHRVDHHFLNTKIENKKIHFLEKLRDFLDKLGQKSGADGLGFISIGMKDWEDRPEMISYKTELDRLGTECFKRYEDLVKLAHEKLPI